MCLKYAMTTFEANKEFPLKKMVLGQPQAMQGGGHILQNSLLIINQY